MTAVVLKLKDERKLYRDLKEMEIKKNQKKNHLFTILNPYYHQQIFWHHQTIGENQRSVSVVSFFGPNVEPSSLLPRPKTATPVVPSSRKKFKQHKMKNLSQTVIIIRYYFFFFFKSFTFFFLKSSPLLVSLF